MQKWQRNLYVIWIAELLSLVGFSVVFPFLPYYVQELGVTDLEEVEMWSGVLLTSHAVLMSIFAPIWGSLADRYGRKLMVERAMFGGAVILAAMGFARNVSQLLVLRALQGCVTGTVAAATTLVASGTPRERTGYALGLLQMAIYGGASVGPVLGGLLADVFGYRAAFFVTGALLLVSGLLVLFLVEEQFDPPAKEDGAESGGLWRGLVLVVRSRALLAVFGVQVIMRLGTRIVTPVLPLFIQTLLPAEGRVASVSGLVTGISYLASAVAAVVLGRFGDRLGYRRVLLACAAGASLLYAPQFFVTAPVQLLVLQSAVGAAMGGTLTTVSAMLAALSPEGRQGAVYGVESSAVSAANAVGPMLGAFCAARFGLRSVFLCSAGVFGLAALGVLALVPSQSQSR
ncbi:MAG: MFS transporter [Chloroflexota bacterium]|nr:MFS transporter [Chloroflexota bacterium]